MSAGPQVRIGLIGAGKMGQALIKGLLAHHFSPRSLRAVDSNSTVRRNVSRRFKLSVGRDHVALVRNADVVILAVKPQQFPDVIGQLAPHLTHRHLVISIAAGIPLRWLQQRLPGVPLVRIMPNLPATVGCGFSAMTKGRWARKRHMVIASTVFGAVGEVVELPERYFDAVTAVSGSGPAYVFFLVHAWEEAAHRLGLPRAVAVRAIHHTLMGSARLLQATREPAVTLMQQVASKGGTTEAALKVLANRRVHRYVGEAVMAAAERSKTLAWA